MSTALLERTRRQSSLANTQVLTYLNSSTACCRISWRVSSNYVSFSGTHLTKLYHSSSSHSSFLCSTHCLTSARFRSPLRTESKSRRGTKNSWFRTLMVRLFPDLLRETHPTFTIFSSSPIHLPQKDTMCLYTSRARLLPLVFLTQFLVLGLKTSQNIQSHGRISDSMRASARIPMPSQTLQIRRRSDIHTCGEIELCYLLC